jgi:hypothetical protein
MGGRRRDVKTKEICIKMAKSQSLRFGPNPVAIGPEMGEKNCLESDSVGASIRCIPKKKQIKVYTRKLSSDSTYGLGFAIQLVATTFFD